MITVIIDARRGTESLPVLLAQLTAGAVDGLVRQVLLVADPGQAWIDMLCEETGAETCGTLQAAAGLARADWLMVAPADFRLRDGWIKSLEGHLGRGGKAARVQGLGGGLLRRGPAAVLVERRRLEDGRGADLEGLGRQLGLPAPRIG
jgi:hypothetical protein